MVGKIRNVLSNIERLIWNSDNAHDQQCDDMTLNHLLIALEWQKRKLKKPPDENNLLNYEKGSGPQSLNE